jgi:hypothetical protein
MPPSEGLNRGSRPMLRAVLAGTLAVVAPALGMAYWSGKISSALWSISSPSAIVRWIEVHNLGTAGADGLYHVEVLERRSIDPPWIFKSLANHMALTEQALRASVVMPLKRGSVYPETYNGGLAKWKAAQADGRAFICTTNVNACLADPNAQ